MIIPEMYVCGAPCGTNVPCIIKANMGVPSKCDYSDKCGEYINVTASGDIRAVKAIHIVGVNE
jgi:hypothetical protein